MAADRASSTATPPSGLPGITYVESDAEAGRWLAAIRGSTELALDTEGASFHRFVDRIYLLQLSTRDHHAVLDPLAIAPPRDLGAMLGDEGTEIVVHDGEYDLRLLRQDFGWGVRRLFDTRVAAQLLGLRQFGLAALLERYFDIRLDKKHQRADWSMRPLPADMLAYAAQDTMHLLPLRDVMREALDKLGRLGWASEEFARMQDVEWAADDAAGAFLRVKGARDLSPRELAILRELVAWRDTAAAAQDRATFRVMGNETLIALAQRPPSTRKELSGVKGVPRGLNASRSAEVLAAIQRGRDVPEGELPRFPRAPRWVRDPNFDTHVNALRKARDEVATKLELDPGVLCSRERLETVARAVPSSVDELREAAGMRRWQVEVLGDALMKALRRAGSAEPAQKPR